MCSFDGNKKRTSGDGYDVRLDIRFANEKIKAKISSKSSLTPYRVSHIDKECAPGKGEVPTPDDLKGPYDWDLCLYVEARADNEESIYKLPKPIDLKKGQFIDLHFNPIKAYTTAQLSFMPPYRICRIGLY